MLSGRLWIGTRVGVLTFAPGNSSAYDEPGLRDGYIRAIVSDNDGHVWVGTDAGAVRDRRHQRALLRTRAGSRRHRDPRLAGRQQRHDVGGHECRRPVSPRGAIASRKFTSPTSAGSDAVRAMFEDDDGALWIGTEDGRLFRGRDGQFEPFAGAQNLGAAVSAILRDRDGNLWVATTGAGVLRLGADAPSWLDMRDRTSNDVRALLEDPEGSLWLGTFGAGLERLHTGKFIPYGPPEGLPGNLDVERRAVARRQPVVRHRCRPHALRARQVRIPGAAARAARTSACARCSKIAPAPSGSARTGAVHIDWQAGRLTRFSTAEGLSGDAVKAIAQDHTGRIWIGTNIGVDLVGTAASSRRPRRCAASARS